MPVNLSPDFLVSVNAPLDAACPEGPDDSSRPTESAGGEAGKKKCPSCNTEYPQPYNYCRIDGTHLEFTNG